MAIQVINAASNVAWTTDKAEINSASADVTYQVNATALGSASAVGNLYANVVSVPNGTIAMNTTNVEDFDRRIVNEFCHLLEKSKQLFNGLRDLPQYGHKQWQVCSFLNNFSLFRFVI